MALRTLLALALAANASAYEWFAVMKLTHEAEYALTLKTLDESMKFYIAELGTSYDAASLDALVDGAEAYMSTYCSDVVADAGVIESDAEQVCKTLAMGSGLTSTYELHIEEHAHRRRLSGGDRHLHHRLGAKANRARNNLTRQKSHHDRRHGKGQWDDPPEHGHHAWCCHM